ncbi:SRPBCC domain-containing protein [Ornithinimicrobium pratense]|uniref:Molecular chaperone Hsp90 n=1 Tax=Ornithinimicrobium pratense TaxID=2593973 RepID=A0A5J6V5E6_9MICO|nr:SRPBCC domain-containing protein [Ornithinimicrobium pratense]QFG68361.1 molecular chaperone Hsp90 [Ornithinimicrobium pratense]
MITGRPEARQGQDHLVLTRTFRAPVEDVWAAITEPERLGRWFGVWSGDPTTGQVQVRWDFEDDVAEETYVIEVCEAPHRLRLHNLADDPGQVWTLDLRLSEQAGRTVLDFAQVMNDALPVTEVGPGWEYYLDRLADSVRTGEVSRVGWDGYLDLAPEYAEAFGASRQ